MKKKLEAELISIAHRILKLKNKSELVQLHQESQKLYEKLSVLLFVEENFAGLQPTIGKSEAYEVLETAFEDSQDEVSQEAKVALDTQEEVALEAEKIVSEEKANHTENIKEKEAVEESESENEEIATIESEEKTKSEEIEPQAEEEKVVVGEIELSEEDLDEEEPTVFETEEPTLVEAEEAVDQEVEPKVEEIATLETSEETKKEDDFMPTFELAFDKKEEETVEEVAKESGHQIIFEDFLGDHYKDLEFVKAEIEKKHEHDHEEENKAEVKPEEEVKAQELVQQEAPKEQEKVEAQREEPKPHVEKVTKGITIGLNDRVGFVNHLFGGSNEDFNRVLSQLNTFDTFQDAKNFIEDLVKPDYNEWKGKEDFQERFLEVVENKFK
ncbi:hypothetical protein [uncultured Flavobacterium sp.]|uniref:hypothetical protein n=1 Tax=uncultured Flavobacterium sp. TaxID=165435 RepID=UPI0025DE4C01|nr:hypothetical protein [uncultured Flavobacterium sp.]